MTIQCAGEPMLVKNSNIRKAMAGLPSSNICSYSVASTLDLPKQAMVTYGNSDEMTIGVKMSNAYQMFGGLSPRRLTT